MEEISFRCPPYLAQRFWLLSAELGETPGSLLRSYMIEEIKNKDSTFSDSLTSATGMEEAEIRQGSPGEQVTGERRA